VAFIKLMLQSGSFRTTEIQGGTTMLAQGKEGLGITAYERHQPEQTLLYQLVEAYYPALIDHPHQQGKSLPNHVHSCKKRGFCPSCGARRMAETAALLADEVFPDVPLRQWVISFPFPLRYLFAAHPDAMGKVLSIVYRAISTHLIHKAGLPLRNGSTGAVTLIQRFGSALPQHSLSYFVSGWRLCPSRRASTPISTRQGARQK
jgi:hypothetical protein